MKYFMLIWAGLWRKPTRTVLTMLSVIVAFLLFGLLQGFNQAISSALNTLNADRLWSTSRMSQTQSIPVAHMTRMKTVPGVTEVTHLTFFGGYFQDSRNSIGAFATNIGPLAAVYPELNITKENVEAMSKTRAGALIGRPLAIKYGWKVGDRIPLGTTIWTNTAGSNTWPMDIVGIYDVNPSMRNSGLDGALWLNWDYFDEARRYDPGHIHQFIIRVKDPTQATAVASAIDKLFENSPDELRTQTETAGIQAQLKQLADIDFIVKAIVGAVLFTLLFLTANTMLQSVRERTPEIAVLRTLGFSGTAVLTLVLLESFLLCAIAAGLGLLLASGTVKAISTSSASIGFDHIPSIVMATGLGLAALLALVSGLPPGWRAKQLNIVDALAGR